MRIKRSLKALHRNIVAVFVMSAFLYSSGCIGPNEASRIIVTQPPSVSLSTYRVVAVDVTNGFNSGNPVSANNQLAGFIIGELRRSAKFGKVYSSSFTVENDADLKLSVVLMESKDLTRHPLQVAIDRQFGGARIVLKQMDDLVKYGHELVALVTVTDAGDGKTITCAVIRSYSKFSGVILTTDTETVKVLSDAIVQFVTSN